MAEGMERIVRATRGRRNRADPPMLAGRPQMLAALWQRRRATSGFPDHPGWSDTSRRSLERRAPRGTPVEHRTRLHPEPASASVARRFVVEAIPDEAGDACEVVQL